MLFTVFDGAVTLHQVVIYLYRRLLVPALAIATLMSIVAAAQWSTPDDVSTSDDSWGTGSSEADDNNHDEGYIGGYYGGGDGGGWGRATMTKDFTWTDSTGTYYLEHKYHMKGRMRDTGDGVAYLKIHVVLTDTSTPSTVTNYHSQWNAGSEESGFDNDYTHGSSVSMTNGHSYTVSATYTAYADAITGTAYSDFDSGGNYVNWEYVKIT
jgi:hypothetical protein